MTLLHRLQRHFWVLALLLALGILTAESYSRFATVRFVTNMVLADTVVPAQDPKSPTGYVYGMRDLILPEMGVDGYHWIMQAQQMLAGGDARIRDVKYDNTPLGREVHWSSGFRWWIATLAWVHSKATGDSLGLSVERVAPYAGTLLLGLILLALTPLIARRFGALPASLFALAAVTVYPCYEYFSTGYPDHHGIVAMFGMMTVLFLAAGGAGWLRAENVNLARFSKGERFLHEWLPERKSARRWFIASAVAGGAGLWVSAATQVPVLAGIGLGALLCSGLCARGAEGRTVWMCDPTLWRLWGVAGFCSSLAFYLLEYFPSRFGLRLEVNHPLYALAWLGAGDLLCRLCRFLRGERFIQSQWSLLGIIGSVVAVALLPLLVAFAKEKTFVVSDAFLWALHEDYIYEFRSLFSLLKSVPLRTTLASENVLPLLGIFMLIFLVFTKLLRPWKALILFSLLPSVVMLCLALQQIRWLGISCAIWFAALVVTSAVTTLPGSGFRWTLGWKIVLTVFVLLILVPFPYFASQLWVKSFQGRPEISFSDLCWLVNRDVAHRMRARMGNVKGNVISGPTMTTALIFHGGFDGVGTLYWENIEGLKATGEIFSAPSEKKAFELIQKRGVTHIVIFSWDVFAEEYAKLARGLRAYQEAPENAFILNLLKTRSIPRWLRPIAYNLPSDKTFEGHWVMIFEVVPDQTIEGALVHNAQFLAEKEKPDEAERNLALALEVNSQSLPALIALAFIQHTQSRPQDFAATLERIRANLGQAGNLELGDRVDLARVLALANDTAGAEKEIRAALDMSDEASLRKLPAATHFDLVSLAEQMKIADSKPEAIGLATRLLPPNSRARLLFENATRKEDAGRPAEALALYRQALAFKPDAFPILNNMAWLLATTTDDSLRNGAEALSLAQRAAKVENSAATQDSLSCAYAELGDFKKAADLSRQALESAEKAGQTNLIPVIRTRLELFEQGKPFRQGKGP